MQSQSGAGSAQERRRATLVGVVVVLAALGMLFWDNFQPDRVLFSNDAPYGAMEADHASAWKTLTGYWHDLNWLGYGAPAASPGITTLLRLITSTLTFCKIYAVFALLFVGWAAWVWARQMRWSPWVAVLLGLLTTLNGDFFATACWGVCAQPIAFGCNFLALAALARPDAPRPWLRKALAGFAVGLGVVEAYDIGALFSLVIGAFVVFQAVQGTGAWPVRLSRAAGELALVAICAGLIAASTINTLLATQIRGVIQTEQQHLSAEARWAWATQWSLPKVEFFSLLVPGLFGYRMDTPGGGDYWGRGGSDPAWDSYLESDRQGTPPPGFFRYGMGSGYAGQMVWVLVAWVVSQLFRRERSVFDPSERRVVLFWLVVAIGAALLMFGRFAPFYQFFYAMPYASAIRNPAKFMHILEWALLILAGHGLQSLWRGWMQPGLIAMDLRSREQSSGQRRTTWERQWLIGSALAFALGIFAWFFYAQARPRLEAHLTEMHLLEMRAHGAQEDVAAAAARARGQAAFSINRVGRTVFFLGLTLGWMGLAVTGRFRGSRAATGAALACAVVVWDLAPANRPWVVTYNWRERLIEVTANPVFELLQQRPWEHRVSIAEPFLPPRYAVLAQLYRGEWMQHQFPYLNIQSPDIVQMPRVPREVEEFESALTRRPEPGENLTNWAQRILRRWELTSTRYLFGAAGMAEALNQQIDPERRRFRQLMAFELQPKGPEGPWFIRTNENGPFALVEFLGALPKVALHSRWEVLTNESDVWRRLPDPDFDPHRTVLVSDPILLPPEPFPGEPCGTVTFEHYEPKLVVLHAKVKRPAVLCLNDKFDPHWKATIGGQPARILRCNGVVRGVYLEPGEHRVEFQYQPPAGPLYVSLVGIGLALILLWKVRTGAINPGHVKT
ncbi:MAG: hypothetical protein RMN51_08345 [Verrucomicrobiota bacterium]|nr:YfhO family protein [Limisphaera sp.]MDW8382098.1 hypothetical protein [Verrucomicrobiota bacterium]